MEGGSLGTFFGVQEPTFRGQQDAVEMIGYGWTEAIGIFKGH